MSLPSEGERARSLNEGFRRYVRDSKDCRRSGSKNRWEHEETFVARESAYRGDYAIVSAGGEDMRASLRQEHG